MTTHEIQAFLYTAQDARRAMNALRRTTATVSGPEPLSEPQSGRAWLLTPFGRLLDRLLQRTCHNTATVPPHRAAHGNEQARMLPEHSAATFPWPTVEERAVACVCLQRLQGGSLPRRSPVATPG